MGTKQYSRRWFLPIVKLAGRSRDALEPNLSRRNLWNRLSVGDDEYLLMAKKTYESRNTWECFQCDFEQSFQPS